MKLFFDTTVLVASVVRDHPHHTRALPAIEQALAKKNAGCVAAHGVTEMYAVLTKLPVKPRIGPDVAHRLVVDNVIAHFQIIALTAREYTRLVGALTKQNVLGGATYDAIHLACAAKADADRIYTFNVTDLRRLALQPELHGRISAP